jgi:circadian clock protein KaiB
MDPDDIRRDTEEFEQALQNPEKKQYVLSLYVAGSTPKSARAIENIKRICEEELAGHYVLEVIDIYRNPKAASDDQVVAAPTLVKRLPLPIRKLLGDLSDDRYVLRGLSIKPKRSL